MKQIALVTGANRGIGLEVCKQLSELGYIVYMGSRVLAKGIESHSKYLNNDINIIPIELDVTNIATIEKAHSIVKESHGHLDVLINNSAIHYDDWQNITSVDFKIIREAIETNTFGPIQVTNCFIPLLKKAKNPRIVNVSSEAGSLDSMRGNTPGYSLSKLALNGITLMYSNKLRSKNFKVNSVCPGWTNTDMGKGGRPTKDGAKSVVWAATLDENGPSGGFFRDGKRLEF